MVCPKCGNEIVVGTKMCISCGYVIPQVQNLPPTPEDTLQAATRPSQTGQIPRLAQTGQVPRQSLNRTGQIPPQKRQQTSQIPRHTNTGELARQSAPKPQTLLARLKKTARNKKMLISISAAALLLITFTVILAFPRTEITFTKAKSTIRTYYSGSENKSYVYADGKKTKLTADGSFSGYTASLDGTVHAEKGSDGSLYLLTKKKLTKIADYAESYTLSQDGDAVAYVDFDGRLILYSSGKTETVSDSVFDYKLSPDGEVLIYSYEDGANDLVLCKFEDGKKAHIGDGVMPVAVSNDGKYIYAYTGGGSLYCYANNWRVKLATEVMPYFFTNKNGDELGFFTSASVAYVSVRGKTAKKLFTSEIEHNGYIYPVTDAHADAVWRIIANAYTTAVETGMNSFADAYLSQAGSVYYIDEGYNALPAKFKTSSGKERGALIYGDSIICIDDDGELISLYLDGSGGRVISQNIVSFTATKDGEYIYFIDSQNDVWVNNGKKSTKLAEHGYMLYSVSDSVVLFMTDFTYETGGTLYYSENGGNKHTVSDKVKSVSVGATSVEYTKDGIVYASQNGKKYNQIFIYN